MPQIEIKNDAQGVTITCGGLSFQDAERLRSSLQQALEIRLPALRENARIATHVISGNDCLGRVQFNQLCGQVTEFAGPDVVPALGDNHCIIRW